MKSISRLPRHIQSGRNLQMARSSICIHCGLAVADEFRDAHMKELHGCVTFDQEVFGVVGIAEKMEQDEIDKYYKRKEQAMRG